MGAERALTAKLARFFAGPARLPVPIGDDAAVVPNRGRTSVVCCDPVVAGVHFSAGDDLRWVGRKVVNRNLSDLAAMGATPDWLLVSLVLPPSMPASARQRLLLGLRDAARAGKAQIVGGDVANGPALVVTVTAIGHLEGRPLRRGGARIGDAIHVSGPLGGSRAGRHLRFTPELRLGRWLARPVVPATAAIDVSDGLVLDLSTLLQASGRSLGAELAEAALPVHPTARRNAGGDRERALASALYEGEDHVLLFTVRAGRTLPRGGPLSDRVRQPIGRVTGQPGIVLLRRDGRREPLRIDGFEHRIHD